MTQLYIPNIPSVYKTRPEWLRNGVNKCITDLQYYVCNGYVLSADQRQALLKLGTLEGTNVEEIPQGGKQ